MPARLADPLAHLLARAKREDDGCLTFTGARHPTGYGIVRLRGRNWRAHRLVYELALGIPEGADVHHHCGNRACVEITHLAAIDRRRHRRLHAELRWTA